MPAAPRLALADPAWRYETGDRWPWAPCFTPTVNEFLNVRRAWRLSD